MKIRVRGTQERINPVSIILKAKNCLGTRTGFWNGLSSDSKVSMYLGSPTQLTASYMCLIQNHSRCLATCGASIALHFLSYELKLTISETWHLINPASKIQWSEPSLREDFLRKLAGRPHFCLRHQRVHLDSGAHPLPYSKGTGLLHGDKVVEV